MASADRTPAGRGALVLVATPIGNLGDLSPRAVEALADADVIACEDTRRTGRLLEHAGVAAARAARQSGKAKPRLLVVNDHTEAGQVRAVLDALDTGQRVAVVTDAGTPGLSDPGERLVVAAANAGHVVEVIPGPSAAITALVASGLPAGRFCFEGFLPRRGAGRKERLAALAGEPRTMVLYEAPHRLAATLADLVDALGPTRRLTIARELTKLHEELWRGSLERAVDWAAAHPPRGEFVLVVAGAPAPPPAGDDAVRAALQAQLAAGASTRDAVAVVASALDVPKRRAYALAVELA